VAQRLQHFLSTRVWDGSKMTRALAKGKRHGTASLEDYAYVARGLNDWAALSGKAEDLELAAQVARAGWQSFFIDNGWYREDGSLLAPPMGSEIMEDGALPSPAAILIATSFDIALQLDDQEWLKTIRGTVNRGKRLIAVQPYWFASHIQALQQVLEMVVKEQP